MASGSYAKKLVPRESTQNQRQLPRRATKHLEEVTTGEEERETGPLQATLSKALQFVHPAEKITMAMPIRRIVVDEFLPHPLERHKPGGASGLLSR